MFGIGNILGGLGSTLAGAGLAAASVIGAQGVPHSAAGWAQLVAGVLAIFAK